MIRAAYGLFCEKGYVATTIQEIAALAKVAVPTVYFTFQTKGVILGETIGAAVQGFEKPVDPEHSAWYRSFESLRDPAAALQLLIENTVQILVRVGPLRASIHAAENDPEVVKIQRDTEKSRYRGYGEMIRILSAKKGLRSGLTKTRATDILFTLLGPELMHTLVEGRGWSIRQCKRWYKDVLSQQLLPH